MNGPHDLGGAQSFGPVAAERDEPSFHAEWERRAAALSLAMNGSGMWSIDMVRQSRERIPPAAYLASSYYEIWVKGLERLLVEHGLVTPGELAEGHAAGPGIQLKRKLDPEIVRAALAKGSPFERPATTPARYAIGDAVRAKVMNPIGHTRLPRYVRGRLGTIAGIHGVHAFPDSNAAGKGENPQWLYSVAFDAREVWGEAARPGDAIYLDLWEPYLERP